MATPTYPLDWLLTPGGEQVVTAAAERVQAVTDPSQAHDRVRAVLLEVDTDTCLNTFGVAPCTATGTPCYNTLATCKDRPNYRRGTKTWRFALRGQAAPPGEAWRPYVDSVSIAATEIKPANGLALRSQTTVTLVDEPDSDVEADPYRAARGTPVVGTFWGRWVARNPNAINRTARLRRGWWGQPFSYSWFADETYIVDQVRGPDRQGRVQIILSDPLKLADKAQLPLPTDGKLAADLKVVAFAGTLQAAAAQAATLAAGGVPDAAAYVDHELYITANLGSGQRRRVVSYEPVSGLVTLDRPWEVIPNGASQFQLLPLYARLGDGEGTQYAGATHVRIGKEIIALSAISGDTLRWASGTSRGAFGSIVEDHDADSAAQRCAVWVDASPTTVIDDMLRAVGVPALNIDTAGMHALDMIWLRGAGNITACISAPTRVSDLLKDVAADLAWMLWWDPHANQVRAQINLPNGPGAVPRITDDDVTEGSITIERQDAERLTQVAQFYAIDDATEDARDARNFLRGEVRVDLDAQSQNEYRDTRPDVRYSRWLTEANRIYVQAAVTRRLNALRDAPARISFSTDPRTVPPLGGLVDVVTRDLPGPDGAPLPVRARVVKLADRGERLEAVALSTPFGGKRWGFIAPAGQPDYAAATAAQKEYAYISPAAGANFADGGGPYRII